MTAAMTSTTSVLETLTSPYLPFDPASDHWSDLIPTPQSESSSPMCPILYNPSYSSAMDLYRTLTSCHSSCVKNSPLGGLELSIRALALTSHLIQLNPSHFSVWQYRANILLFSPHLEQSIPKSSGDDGRDAVLRSELVWLEQLAHKNMKSYQVWQHRRVVVSALGDPARELEFVRENLARDSKNYHTWGYLQWILAHFGGLSLLPLAKNDSNNDEEKMVVGSKGAGKFAHLWDGQVEYVDMLLKQDCRNNSAWNHRWYVNFARFGLTGNNSNSSSTLILSKEMKEEMEKKIKYEIAYTKANLTNVPNNSSAWNYLRSLHINLPFPFGTPLIQEFGWIKTLVSTHVEAQEDFKVDIMGRSSIGALEWWLDIIANEINLENSKYDSDHDKVESLIQEAETLVKRLIIADGVRKRFWALRLKNIRRSLITTTN
ncbi:related to Protein farnesyltransferase alpha subunit [Melanopsichium pennsylvanicum]|uniref:Protein farnesyltransferase/geranylgeranyltransferase type-1 subunit alpha n=1 Tax=Melanopsichium pennsylvanicum TaxID=63383 RepID=A0AAJ4XKE1_9BASI|nr:related to Protein farnesyltransferase alpha subunit [Melanopsichium pennsylvanicum]